MHRGFEVLEDRRLLAATTEDIYSVVPNTDNYDAGGLLQSQSLHAPLANPTENDVVDLSVNQPGDQAFRLTLEERLPDDIEFDPLAQFAVLHERIHVDRSSGYELSAFGLNHRLERLRIAYAAFDSAGRRIEPVHVNQHPGATDTTLIQSLNPGDTEIIVADATGWSQEVGLPSDSRAIAWYGADTGITPQGVFQDFGYTRLTASDLDGGLWDVGGIEPDAASSGFRITLRQPWSGPAIDAGTAIRNAVADDGTFELDSIRYGAAQEWEYDTYFGRGYIAQHLGVHVPFGAEDWRPAEETQVGLPPDTASIQFLSNHVLTQPTIRPAGDATADAPAVATFDGDARAVANRSLQLLESDLLFAIDPSRSYELSVVASVHGNSVVPEKHSIGYTAYDRDGQLIEPQHVQRYATAVDTTLAADLSPGDTLVVLSDATGWSNDDSNPRTRTLAWYGYTDSKGTTYADHTYTRNVAGKVNGLWSPGAIVGNSIQLDQPWDGPAISAGTAVRNAVGGDAIIPAVLENDAISTEPSRLQTAASISGTWSAGGGDLTMFPPATASIRPAAQLNQSNLQADDVVILESFAVSEVGFNTVTPDASHRYALNLDVAANDPLVIGGANVDLIAVSTPQYGSATVAADGTVDYVAPPWFVGLDKFTYTLRDIATGDEHVESVSVQVGGTNYAQDAGLAAGLAGNHATSVALRPPIANDDAETRGFYDVLAGQTMIVDGFSQLDLLYNDVDNSDSPVDYNKPLSVWLLDGPQHGSLTLNPDGTFAYTPDDGFPEDGNVDERGFGIDSFQYAVFDGLRIDTAIAQIRVFHSQIGLVRSRLHALSLAIHNFHSQYHELPVSGFGNDGRDPSGVPYLSWRVHVLPQLGYELLHQQFDINQPYDSPTNLPLLDLMPDVFRTGIDGLDQTLTRIQMLQQSEPYGPDHPFQIGVGLPTDDPTFFDFRDGIESTIMLVQTGADLSVPWTAPQEAQFNADDPVATIGTPDPTGILVAMADGQTLRIPTNVNPDDFLTLATRALDERIENAIDVDTMLRGWLGDRFDQAIVDGYYEAIKSQQFQLLGLGFHRYHSANNQLPPISNALNADPNGHPTLSWRVYLLPFIGQQELYDQFALDEPWDSPTNLALVDKMPDIYRSIGDPADSTTTRIQVLDALGTVFGPNADGTYRRARFRDILDGDANTIMAVETGPDKAVPWTRPGDVTIDWNDPLLEMGDLSGSGVIRLLMADGGQLNIPAGIDSNTFRELATLDSFRSVDNTVHTETVEADSLRRRYDDLNLAETENSIANKTKEISLAFHNYHSAFRQLPLLNQPEYFDANGNPKLSWRVFLLPWLGQSTLWIQFHLDEPWDSPHNLSLLQYMPDVYRSLGESWDSTTTRMQGVTAAPEDLVIGGTFFGARRPDDVGPYSGRKFRDALDGLANTFLFGEVGSDKGVPWTKPADVPFDPFDPLGPFGDIGEGMRHARADGSSLIVSPDIDPVEFGELLLIADRGEYPYDLAPPAVDLAIQEGSELGRIEVRRRHEEADTVDVVVGDPGLLSVHPSTLTFHGEEEIPVDLTFHAADNGFRDGPRQTTITIGDRVYNVTVHDSADAASQLPAPKFVDDGDPEFQLSGGWFHVANYGYGADAKAIATNAQGTASWTFAGLSPGQYDISATWLNGGDRATTVSYVIRDGAGGPVVATLPVSQRVRPSGPIIGGRPFESLGSVTITGETLVVEISNAGADGAVIADAVRIQEIILPPDSPEITVRRDSETVFDGSQFNFVPVVVGTARSQTFTVHNEGTADLILQPISLNGSKFSLASPNFTAGQVLAPGGTTSFTVDVDTSSVGIFNGTLSLGNNDADEAPFDLTLSATVRDVAPASLLIDDGDPGFALTGGWFHVAGYGYAADAKAIAPNATGTATWTFAGIAAGEYDVSLTWLNGGDRASNIPYVIRDGIGGPILATVPISQRVPPSGQLIGGRPFASLGSVVISGDTLVVEVSNAGTSGAVIADAVRIEGLTPPANAPEIAVAEGTLTVLDGGGVNFGSAPQGAPSLSKTFTVANNGTADLTLEPIVVTGAGFTLESANFTSGQVLAAGASVSFAVGLSTANVGNFQGSVRFANSDADENPFDFAVSGNINTPPPAGVHLIDNGDTGFAASGNWAHVAGYGFAADALAGNGINGVETAQWVFDGLTAGTYDVVATWLRGSDRADNVTYVIRDGVGGAVVGTVTVDQRQNPNGSVHGGRPFEVLDQFTISGEVLVVEISTAGTTKAVIVDAIRIERR